MTMKKKLFCSVFALLSSVAVFAADAPSAAPQPGLKSYSDTYKVQHPYDLRGSDRFSVTDGPVYNLFIIKGDKGFTDNTKTGARTEMRWNTNWNKKEHFWEADVMIDPGSEGTAIMQVHATDCACEPIYVQVIANGDLRNDGNHTVIAHNMWGKWFHMVASYDPDSGDGRVWINGDLVVTRNDLHPHREWYFKNGVYGIKGDKSTTHFKNVKFWTR